MNELCKKRLLDLEAIGSKNERKICHSLLNLSNKEMFFRLEDISSHFNISNSSVTRFIKKIKYPSFKHFIYDLNSKPIKKENTFEKKFQLKSEILLNNSQDGEFFIITSRNGKGIAKLMRERLNVIGKPTNYYHEYKHEMEEFVYRIHSEDTVILITMSGWSNTVSKALTELAKLDNKPQIFIFSVNKWTKSFDKYDYIKWIFLDDNKQNINGFETYNSVSMKFLKIIFLWLNKLYKKENQKI